MGAEWNNVIIKCQEFSPPIKSHWLHREATVSPIGTPDLSPPTDSILSTNTLEEWVQVRDGDGNDGVWPGTYGRLYKLWTNWREVLRDSSNLCPGCGDEKCDPGFARTPYKHRTPCGEFDNWISEILNATNMICAAEIRSGWCCGAALTKWSEMDYLSREGEQTVTVKQIFLSFHNIQL